MHIKGKALLIVMVFVLVLVLFMSGCGKNTERAEGGTAESSAKYYTAGNELLFYKTAPYTTRLDGTTAYADFSATPLYNITQFVEVPLDTMILEFGIKNIAITQPKVGKVTFDKGDIGYSEIKPVQQGSNSVVFRSSGSYMFTGPTLGMRLDFKSSVIGKYTLKDYTTIRGTSEEAAQYFDRFVIDNGIKAEDLRFSVKYRVELKVLEDNKEAVYYRDVTVTMLPGDFFSSHNQPVKTENREPLLK